MAEPCFQAQLPRMLLTREKPKRSRDHDMAERSSTMVKGSDHPSEHDEEKRMKELRAYCRHLTQLARALYDHLYNATPPSPLRDNSNPALLANAASVLPGAWRRGQLFSLRHAIMAVVARWQQDPSFTEPCPIGFTADEISAHKSEWEQIDGWAVVLHAFQEVACIGPRGMVPTELFEAVSAFNEHFRKKFVNMAENEEGRKLHDRAWPYQDHE